MAASVARLEALGAFALTEPDHGSDSIALETTARRDATTGCSTATRSGSPTAASPTSSWSYAGAAPGPAVAGYDAALTYAKRRRRVADLQAAGTLDATLAGLAKMHNTSTAREVLAEARDLLGNGILLACPTSGHPHLRGHRVDADAHRRPRHHRLSAFA